MKISYLIIDIRVCLLIKCTFFLRINGKKRGLFPQEKPSFWTGKKAGYSESA
jgi:hypothetical protein